jgi:hypothetical protein
MILNNAAAQLDDLLDRMARELQLDKTRRERMLAHYEAVKNWIESDEIFFKPYRYDVYPHGSVRILTTVKPWGQEEFDLDIVVHLKTDWRLHTPQRIYNELKRRLSEHSTYREMIELKNRCIRLNYAGDFHMDILTGIQESITAPSRLMVPDRKLGTWASSNPRGYAEWFIARAESVKESLLEKAMRAEGLPADNYERKKPLQIAVQLLKRYRDMYFHDKPEYRTSSIVLTTIAGLLYEGEESIFDSLAGIVTRARRASIPNQRLKLLNPVNPQEDFTDKWDDEPQYYVQFLGFIRHINEQLRHLTENYDVIAEGRIMKGLFGEDTFNKAQQGQTKLLEEMRKKKTLFVDRKGVMLSGAGTAGTISVKSNTFYGS